MPLFLLAILNRVAAAAIAGGASPREQGVKIRARARLEGANDITANQVRNIRRQAIRRLNLGRRLQDEDEVDLNRGQIPRCPEYSSGAPQYHYTSYADTYDANGNFLKRVRIIFDDDDFLSGSEIVDQAVNNYESSASGASLTGGLSPEIPHGSQIDSDSISIGEVCYG